MNTLPKSWIDLAYKHGDKQSEWWTPWTEMTQLPQPFLHKVFRILFRPILKNKGFAKLPLASWQEFILYLASQTAIIDDYLNDAELNKEILEIESIKRHFNQLPCTSESLKARVVNICEKIPVDSKILILGDDDYLSLELFKNGYKNITVIDIDPTVIEKIQKEEPLIYTHVHNLENDPPLHLQKEYDFITFDCPYSISGFLLFFNASLKFNLKNSAKYLANISLLCLLDDYESFLKILEEKNCQVFSYDIGINHYPITPIMNFSYQTGKFFLRFLLEKKHIDLYLKRLLFVTSDALWLEYKK